MNWLAKIQIFALLVVSCGQQDTGFYSEPAHQPREQVPLTPAPGGNITVIPPPKTSLPPTPALQPDPALTPAPTSTPIPVPPIPTPLPCTELPKTIALLKTKQVNQSEILRVIKYDVSIIDCNGNPLAFNADYFMFDYDGHHLDSPIMTGLIKFKITNPLDSQEISGDMLKIVGSDLFNRKGPKWEHYKTEKIIAFKQPTKVFNLEMDISKVFIISPVNASSYTPEGYMIIGTFLKFGEAIPIEGDVIFK